MTLKEKLKSEFPINTEKKSNKFANKCVRVADEYAIEFAEWLLNSSYFFNIGMKEMTFGQLLEIYKKEKGL
jgi:hypothetical protein